MLSNDEHFAPILYVRKTVAQYERTHKYSIQKTFKAHTRTLQDSNSIKTFFETMYQSLLCVTSTPLCDYHHSAKVKNTHMDIARSQQRQHPVSFSYSPKNELHLCSSDQLRRRIRPGKHQEMALDENWLAAHLCESAVSHGEWLLRCGHGDPRRFRLPSYIGAFGVYGLKKVPL